MATLTLKAKEEIKGILGGTSWFPMTRVTTKPGRYGTP